MCNNRITCENLINHCLLRYTEYHHSRFISPVNKSHSQLNSNYQSNWNEMQSASQSLSIQIQMLINVYVPKELNRHRRCYKLNYEQKTKEIYSTIKCPNRLSTISNVSNMTYESSDYKLSPRLKWKKLLRLNYNRKLQTFNHALIPQNANFHNSTSCRTFDEVKTCPNLYQLLITIMQKIAIAETTMKTSQNATNCHEMPCNHQFERRYITPTVTYVEKPNRVPLNPLVSGQLTRFLIFIWEIRWNK